MFGTRAFCALLLCLPLPAQVFSTGEPVVPPNGSAMRPMTPSEYKTCSASAAGRANIRVIRQLPPKLSRDYRVGINFVYDLTNYSWILDRDSDGYKLFLDLKGDGDLSNAEPYRFHQDGVRRIDIPMRNDATRWTARFELVEDPHDANDVSICINLATYRFGKVCSTAIEFPSAYRALAAGTTSPATTCPLIATGTANTNPMAPTTTG